LPCAISCCSVSPSNFRNDEGELLEQPTLTSPAPNAGAIAKNSPKELPLIREAFRRRSEYVLALSARFGYRRLVLGAWGCGVFRNDPVLVAREFASHLADKGQWRGRFDRVVFSVLDTSSEQETFGAFQQEFEKT